ncbi:DJ-1/PfpI family protein [Massilia glaciei]|uniref:DJ-1/PfpI family protein n=1 Tax=Massilia glaciei TaxID=1524097 RepID=A0A2U2I5U0_9BURK|nr:DJ-1/PfpI family protein [Massilia glaciei]PWF55015.1 DJ-1/PfpI family protein [Massilia glaciei]
MHMAVVLFDGYTALDIIGGYEVLANIPGMKVDFAAVDKGLVAADTGRLGIVAYKRLDDIGATDLLYIPGGPGVRSAIADAALMDHVRRLHASASWTVSVCNGAEILGAAGLIDGKEVTTNWFARDRVRAYGATVLEKRFHRDGTIVTGAGVSASIDAALYLAALIGGEELSRILQLGIEYYPAPPFGSSTPDLQPARAKQIIEGVEKSASQRLAARTIPF